MSVKITTFVVTPQYLEGELELDKKHILWRFENGDAKIIPLEPLTETEFDKVVNVLYSYIQAEPN